jgi:hypothetical protein
MRLRVRRLYSPLIESKASAIATSGSRKPRKATKDGSGSRAVVSRRKKRKASWPTVSLISPMAP